MKLPTSALIVLVFAFACDSSDHKAPKPIQVELVTTKGTIVLELSDKTPKHRDNFVKLVNEGFYDSLLFHRVVEGFGIQTGNPDTRSEEDTLPQGPGYTLPAEIHPELFHKRGALNAARTNNPARASSGSQFFLVQRGPLPDSLIDRGEERINRYLSEYYAVNDPDNQEFRAAFDSAMENEDWETVRMLSDSLSVLAETQEFERYTIPEAHREVYRKVGGTPHLDQNYTVFGEVVSGMDVVDSIAVTPVDDRDWPLEEVRILKAQVIEN